MPKSIVSEGKTTNEAIEKGLKELNVSKDMVDIKVLESEEKRSFFSILAPRVVKVELTLKENKRHEKRERKEIEISEEIEKKAKKNINKFLEEFMKKANFNDVKYDFSKNEFGLNLAITGKDAGALIGYRGETLNAMQDILSSVASRGLEQKVRVVLDIEGYRKKREKALEQLAEKVAKTVIRTGKSITLEPMHAYERKIIHSRLQNNRKITTHSIGEEPYRKLVISLNK